MHDLPPQRKRRRGACRCFFSVAVLLLLLLAVLACISTVVKPSAWHSGPERRGLPSRAASLATQHVAETLPSPPPPLPSAADDAAEPATSAPAAAAAAASPPPRVRFHASCHAQALQATSATTFAAFLRDVVDAMGATMHGAPAISSLCRRWPQLLLGHVVAGGVEEELLALQEATARSVALQVGIPNWESVLELAVGLRKRGFAGPLLAYRTPLDQQDPPPPSSLPAAGENSIAAASEETFLGLDAHSASLARLSGVGGLAFVDHRTSSAGAPCPEDATGGDSPVRANSTAARRRIFDIDVLAHENVTLGGTRQVDQAAAIVIFEWNGGAGEGHAGGSSREWLSRCSGVPDDALPSAAEAVLGELSAARLLAQGTLVLLADALGDPRLTQLHALFAWLQGDSARELCLVAAFAPVKDANELGQVGSGQRHRGLLFQVV